MTQAIITRVDAILKDTGAAGGELEREAVRQWLFKQLRLTEGEQVYTEGELQLMAIAYNEGYMAALKEG